jgi:hypothetical protein
LRITEWCSPEQLTDNQLYAELKVTFNTLATDSKFKPTYQRRLDLESRMRSLLDEARSRGVQGRLFDP